jgi:thymidylate synthase ThyX
MADDRQDGSSRFTAQERALLARYVTNSDGPVFALTQLPEVVKGALFSRYSRSALGLRELLLKEFISDPAAEFAAIGSARAAGADPEAAAREAHLAVERAQDFYGRILDGYGDDSIGELGGAHLAIENVSMIATKVLEDARIGGSPLEKSTRYVYFGEPVGGDFLFYKEPTLLASRHAERYLATCRMLFETYRGLVGPLTAAVERAAPRPAGTSEAAWRRSVRAQVYDALRGLLPAAALTNMGIFGNGRFFETLLMRLRVAPLAELRALGGAMAGELGKLIPAFIRRADPRHPHFAAYRAYEARLAAWLAGAAPPAERHGAGGGADGAARDVELLDWDPDAPAKVLAALDYPQASAPLATLREAAARLTPAEQARRLAALAALRENRRHKPPRALELASYTFDLLGDYGMYRDLHRHRMLTQQRQPLSTRHGYALPDELREAGLEAPFAAAMDAAAQAYEAIAAEHPAEAQYVVPMAYRIRWHMHVNLRALIWLVELRSAPQGHPAYRRMAQALYRRVAEAHPAFAPLFRFVDLEDYALGRMGAEQRQEDKRHAAEHRG